MNKDYAAKIVQKNMYYRFTSGSYLKKKHCINFSSGFCNICHIRHLSKVVFNLGFLGVSVS